MLSLSWDINSFGYEQLPSICLANSYFAFGAQLSNHFTHLMLTPSHILINNCSKVQLLSSVPTPDQHSLILHPLV